MKGIYIVVVIALCAAYVSSTPVKHLTASTNTNTCNKNCKGDGCDAATCWKNKYDQAAKDLKTAEKELQKVHDRRDQKSKNKNLCSKWGSLQNLCNIIMVTEQTAEYPLKCSKSGDPNEYTTCKLKVAYYSDDSKLNKRNKFVFEVTGEGCEFLHGASGRDEYLRNCSLNSNLENFAANVVLGSERQETRRRRLLQAGNADC